MKRTSPFILSMALCIPLLAEDASGVARKVNELLHEAARFSMAGRYDLAIKRCKEALALDSKNVGALAQLEATKRQQKAAALKAAGDGGAKAFHPTFPPQEIAPLLGPDFFK